jgi:hypothetical protein
MEISPDWTGEAPGFDAPTARAFGEHPRFLEAVRKAASDKARLFDADRRLHRFAIDRGSSLLGLFALALHYSDQGLTVGGLQAMRAESNFCSPGRASAFVAAMRRSGHFVSADIGAQRRTRRLAVSDAFIAFQKSRVHGDMECLSLISPIGTFGLRALSRQGYFADYVRTAGSGLAQVANLHNERVEFFSERNIGLLVLFDLVAHHEATLDSNPVALSISQLSKQFDASRTHVLRLLRDADKAGLLAWAPDARQVALLPPLVRAIKSYFAHIFAGTAACIWAIEARRRT